jgi:signal transduction histidine kinase
VSEDLPLVYTDLPRLRQILINLLSNAAKFTAQGSIAIAARPASPGHFILSVADTGIGIPAQALDYIFEEFRQVDGSTTRKYGGTGLGLSISKKLAQMLGGTIQVESEVGKGSVFTLTLPLQCGLEPAATV